MKKAIMVMFDSLNQHYLPPYGCEWVHAPNFERLAEKSVVFDNCYAGSMPCMPARRELHTGRYNFLHRSWGPIEPFDDSMPHILKNNNVYTHLVSDHMHYWEDGSGTYHTRYNTWEIVRGQQGDPWKGHVPTSDQEWAQTQGKSRTRRQDPINREYMPTEAEHSQTRVFDRGLEFIKTNHDKDGWFLQIETFDPHEPFFMHQKYKALYLDEYSDAEIDWPPYDRVNEPLEMVEHVQKIYAALVSMCDYSLGRVMDEMDRRNMWDDTLLIVCTDHGFLLGEHNWWAKLIQPWFNEVVHTPLFIWDPRCQIKGERRESLVQMIDMAPTLLDYFNVDHTPDMQGLSLEKAIAAGEPTREVVLYGAYGGHVNITDGRYTYMRAPKQDNNGPLFEYTHMPTHMNTLFSVEEMRNIELAEPFTFTKGTKTMKIPARTMINPYYFGTMLFDLETDPRQEHPIIDENIERRMIELMVNLMQANDAPVEQYERLNLPVDGQVLPKHLQLAEQYKIVLEAMHPQELQVGTGRINLETPLKVLLADEKAAEIFERHFHGVNPTVFINQAGEATLVQISKFAPGLFTQEKLDAFSSDLEHLKR